MEPQVNNSFEERNTDGRKTPMISIVIPAYNEEGNLFELYKDLQTHIEKIGESIEIIFVDDGSSDNTWQVITELQNIDKRVKGIQFSRNFGHQYALFAGLQYARGDAVITMDADMQHPPEMIPKLINEWKTGKKVVQTIRTDLKELSGFKKITSKLYYKIFSFLTGVKLEHGMADFRLLDRQVIESILSFREEGLFLRGIVQWVGYPASYVGFQCRERFSGTTKYSLRRMIKFGAAGVTSFSIIPLRIGIAIGILISLFSFYLIINTLHSYYLGLTIPGWTTTVTVMSFMFGMLFILLGLLGEYIGRILIEVRGRPLYLVQNFSGFGESTDNTSNDQISYNNVKRNFIPS